MSAQVAVTMSVDPERLTLLGYHEAHGHGWYVAELDHADPGLSRYVSVDVSMLAWAIWGPLRPAGQGGEG